MLTIIAKKLLKYIWNREEYIEIYLNHKTFAISFLFQSCLISEYINRIVEINTIFNSYFLST